MKFFLCLSTNTLLTTLYSTYKGTHGHILHIPHPLLRRQTHNTLASLHHRDVQRAAAALHGVEPLSQFFRGDFVGVTATARSTVHVQHVCICVYACACACACACARSHACPCTTRSTILLATFVHFLLALLQTFSARNTPLQVCQGHILRVIDVRAL